MKKVIAIADRSAAPVLKLLALVNLLFFLSFAVMLALATGRAHADDMPACTGKNLLSEVQTGNPAQYARIEAEAARTENGEGLLWKIEKAGAAPSYLFGTMHMTDPRVTTLPAAAQKAFDAAGTMVIETTDVLDQARMMAVLAKQPDLMMFTDGTSLTSLLTPEQAAEVDKALGERGIPAFTVAKMKPWIISAMVALPACELLRKAKGAPVLDVKLAQDAKAAGKTVEGLETAASQLEAMASLPMKFHIDGLVQTLKLGDRMDDVIETMVVLYTQGETGIFWPLFKTVLPSEPDGAEYGAFEQTMITARNHGMVATAGPILARGNAFMAIGALHLPGPEGLVALFRKAGYTVSAVKEGL